MPKKKQLTLFRGLLEDPSLVDIESPRDAACDSDGDLCASCYLPRALHADLSMEHGLRAGCRKFRFR